MTFQLDLEIAVMERKDWFQFHLESAVVGRLSCRVKQCLDSRGRARSVGVCGPAAVTCVTTKLFIKK
ncbi:hypothetical protein Hamer_G003573 [Homarus americanus]|uniref:Uncharacterized protein n=1 Tax=Homarus americanus TaxID=6706 RepID=A0A8J5JZ89_HOMAM|nr:hypothetical protein Hamer_G003573 [Homarus americanus]